jgi:molecular chaperone GrpE
MADEELKETPGESTIPEEIPHEEKVELSHEEKTELPHEEKGEVTFDSEAVINALKKEIEELKDKYMRLYAEFENYKRMAAKEREEIIKYSNEALINNLIPSIDNLEMALKHAESSNSGLVEGVRLTLKEILRSLEKVGLSPIDCYMKPFDPLYHEAMSMVEREDLDEMTVVEEYRRGYIYKDKVLRPALVAVSKKPEKKEEEQNSM